MKINIQANKLLKVGRQHALRSIGKNNDGIVLEKMEVAMCWIKK
jgi:hypothetical protein